MQHEVLYRPCSTSKAKEGATCRQECSQVCAGSHSPRPQAMGTRAENLFQRSFDVFRCTPPECPINSVQCHRHCDQGIRSLRAPPRANEASASCGPFGMHVCGSSGCSAQLFTDSAALRAKDDARDDGEEMKDCFMCLDRIGPASSCLVRAVCCSLWTH